MAEVFSPHIPRKWGATLVAAEVGCGTGVRFISRRLAFANLDLRSASLKLGTTLIASCTLMSASWENKTTCLSRCLVEPGTAVAHNWVTTWPYLFKLSSVGTPQPCRAGPPRLSMRPTSGKIKNVFDHFRRVPIASAADQHSTVKLRRWRLRASRQWRHMMSAQSLRHVVMPVAQRRVITTLPWDVVTSHCHGLTCPIRRCCPD